MHLNTHTRILQLSPTLSYPLLLLLSLLSSDTHTLTPCPLSLTADRLLTQRRAVLLQLELEKVTTGTCNNHNTQAIPGVLELYAWKVRWERERFATLPVQTSGTVDDKDGDEEAAAAYRSGFCLWMLSSPHWVWILWSHLTGLLPFLGGFTFTALLEPAGC